MSKIIEELEQQIIELNKEHFSYFCNDQYDMCDILDIQIKEIQDKIDILKSDCTKNSWKEF